MMKFTILNNYFFNSIANKAKHLHSLNTLRRNFITFYLKIYFYLFLQIILNTIYNVFMKRRKNEEKMANKDEKKENNSTLIIHRHDTHNTFKIEKLIFLFVLKNVHLT